MVDSKLERDGGVWKKAPVSRSEMFIEKKRAVYPFCNSADESFVVLFPLLFCPDFQDKAAHEQSDDAADVIGEPTDIVAEIIRNENTKPRDDQDEQ